MRRKYGLLVFYLFGFPPKLEPTFRGGDASALAQVTVQVWACERALGEGPAT